MAKQPHRLNKWNEFLWVAGPLTPCTRGHEGTRYVVDLWDFSFCFTQKGKAEYSVDAHIPCNTPPGVSGRSCFGLHSGPWLFCQWVFRAWQTGHRQVCARGGGSETASCPDLVSSHHSPAQNKKHPAGQTSSSHPHCRNETGKEDLNPAPVIPRHCPDTRARQHPLS